MLTRKCKYISNDSQYLLLCSMSRWLLRKKKNLWRSGHCNRNGSLSSVLKGRYFLFLFPFLKEYKIYYKWFKQQNSAHLQESLLWNAFCIHRLVSTLLKVKQFRKISGAFEYQLATFTWGFMWDTYTYNNTWFFRCMSMDRNVLCTRSVCFVCSLYSNVQHPWWWK